MKQTIFKILFSLGFLSILLTGYFLAQNEAKITHNQNDYNVFLTPLLLIELILTFTFLERISFYKKKKEFKKVFK